MKKTRIIIVTVALLLVIALSTGCSTAASQAVKDIAQSIQSPLPSSPTNEEPAQIPSEQTAQQAKEGVVSTAPGADVAQGEYQITQEDAIKAVASAYPQYEVGFAEIDYKNGIAYWEVNVYDPAYKDDHDVYVNATTGLVSDYEAAADGTTPTITQQQAEKAALDKFPGYTIRSVDYDKKNGVYYWEIEVMDNGGFDHDVYVNATDGTVTSERDIKQNVAAQNPATKAPTAKQNANRATNQNANRQNYDNYDDDRYDYDDHDDYDDYDDYDDHDDDRYDD